MPDEIDWFDEVPTPPIALPNGDGAEVVSFPKRGKRPPQPGWKKEWQLSSEGTPLTNLINGNIALENHPMLVGLVRFDLMDRRVIVQRNFSPNDPPAPRPIAEFDVLAIQEELQRTGLRRISKATTYDAIMMTANAHSFHPVKDYLNGLVWDGEQRCRGWLGRYLGVEGTTYSDVIGRMFLIAMVARIFEPGCQADYMLILEGPQGARKSTACKVLAGDWFSDSLPDLSRGDAVRLSMHLRGKWLIEIAEMSSFSSAEVHTLKQFLTQKEEKYTPKYGRDEVVEPRQCVFIGTTNESVYLRDPTGARRFWPIKVGDIDIDELRADRGQLFAEAVHLYRAGAEWFPDADFEATHIAPEQDARYEEDAWQEMITDWLSANARAACRVNEILKDVLGLAPGQFGTREQRRVSGVLTKLRWVCSKANGARIYRRPEA